MNGSNFIRSPLATVATFALATLGCLGACGDDAHSYGHIGTPWYDGGTYEPSHDAGRDTGGPDVCSTCGATTCVDLESDVANCGGCGLTCPVSDHGAATCTRGGCGLTCDPGFELHGGDCARVVPPPRPVAPLSGATVTRARPTLRWALAPTTDGAEVDICPTRACDHDAETFTAHGDSFVPPRDLAPGAHFWRLHGRGTREAGTSSSPTWEFFVGHRSAATDTSAGAVADFNGDGYADVVVADPAASRVYIYWGGPNGVTDASRTTLKAPAGNVDCGMSCDGRGLVVASAGDLDGDGYPELVVGDGAHDRILLFRGGANGPSDASMQILETPFALQGSFGGAVAAAGDIDGDGYGDLVVGARGLHAVRVYRGGPNGVSNANGMTLAGPEITSSFGAAVAGAGDVDGDGYADVIVGAPNANAGAGAAYVYFGGPTMLARGPSITIPGPDVAFGGFGSVLAFAGDVNGDGFADLLVGAPESISKSGRAYLFLGGMNGMAVAPSTRFDGGAAGDYVGASVAAIGDIDGDGFADIAIGSPGIGAALGRVDVYRGSASGILVSSRVTLTSPDGENFGAAIGGSGDTDGDGFADFIVGARAANHAYVFRGAASGITGTPSVTLAGPDTTSRTFGRAVAMYRHRGGEWRPFG